MKRRGWPAPAAALLALAGAGVSFPAGAVCPPRTVSLVSNDFGGGPQRDVVTAVAVNPAGSDWVSALTDGNGWVGFRYDDGGNVLSGGGLGVSGTPWAAAVRGSDGMIAVAGMDVPSGNSWLIKYFNPAFGAAPYAGFTWGSSGPGPEAIRGIAWAPAYNTDFLVVGGARALGASFTKFTVEGIYYFGGISWVYSVGGLAGNDSVYGVAVDGTFAYAVGKISDLGVDAWQIVKINLATGAPPAVWTQSYLAALGDAQAKAVAVDASGNIIVAGWEDRTDLGESHNWLVRKYDSAGALLWSVSWQGTSGGSDEATGVALTPGGDIVVTGFTDRADVGEKTDWTVNRYSAAGALLGTWQYDAPAHGVDVPLGIAAAGGSRVLVGGEDDRTDIGQGQNAIVKRIDVAPADCLEAAVSVAPLSALPGAVVTVDLTVTAVGATWLNVSPVLEQFGNGISATILTAPAGGVPSLTAGSAATFSWSLSVTANRYSGFRVYAQGNSSATMADDPVRRYGSVNPILYAPVSFYSYLGQGQTFSVTVTASHRDGWRLTGVSAALGVANGPASVVGGPFPAGPTDLAIGGSIKYVWSVSATGAGLIQMSLTVTGYDPTTGVLASANRPLTATAYAPAALEGAVSLSTTQPLVGQTVTVTYTVTNAGGAAVAPSGPLPQLVVDPGGGGAGVTVLSSPSFQSTLAGGSSTRFVWSFRTNLAGPITFTVSMAGYQLGALQYLTVSHTGGCTVLAAGALAATLTVDAAQVVFGQIFTAHLTVTNTGDTTVTGVAPEPGLAFNKGAGTLQGAVTPAGPVTLGPGASTTFTWVYQATVAGQLALTGTATGTESVSGGTVFGVASGGLISAFSAAFGGTLTVSPALLVDRLTVTWRVTDIGQYSALNVVPSLAISAGATLVSLESGPMPATVGSLAAGASQDFVWTFHIKASGSVTFTASVTGTDTAPPNPTIAAAVTASVVMTRLADTDLPPAGTFHIRNNILRIGAGVPARIVLHAAGGGGTVDLALYTRAGAYLDRIGTGPVTLDAAGLAVIPFAGALSGSGKTLATGMYWVLATGALTDKQRLVVVGE